MALVRDADGTGSSEAADTLKDKIWSQTPYIVTLYIYKLHTLC